MSATVVTPVRGAALLHATWNAPLQRGRDRLPASVIVAGAASVVAIPALFVLPPIFPTLWPLPALASILHNGDNLLPVRASADGDPGPIRQSVAAAAIRADRETRKAESGGLVFAALLGRLFPGGALSPRRLGSCPRVALGQRG